MKSVKIWRGLMLTLSVCLLLGGCASLKDNMRSFGDKMVEFDEWFQEHLW